VLKVAGDCPGGGGRAVMAVMRVELYTIQIAALSTI
jgi:hypothetical protein